MRSPFRALLLVALLSSPTAGHARELRLSWDGQLVWDSNPLRMAQDEESGTSLYGGPSFEVRQRGRQLDFLARYSLRYEQYLGDLSSANGFEHFARTYGAWRLSRRSEFELSHAFSRTRGLSATFIEPVPGIDPIDAVADLQLRRSPVTRNIGSLMFRHNFSERWFLESSADGVLYDYQDDRRAPSQSVRGSVQMLRVLSRRLVTGAGLALNRNQFDDTDVSVGSGSTIAEAFGVVRYQISPTLSLRFSGGPAWSQPDSPADTAFVTRQAVRPDLNSVARLVDPSRCIVPVGGPVPAGTVSLQSCPRTDVIFVPPGTNTPVFAPSALIDTVAINADALRFSEVDVLGDTEDPSGTVTFFGNASLEKRWRNLLASVFYQRRTSTAAGLNQTTNLDLATALLTWEPDRRRWRFTLRGTWTLQTAAFEQPFTDFLLDPTPVTVYVDSRGRVFDTPVAGATQIDNAARVVGVRRLGLFDTGYEVETYRADFLATRRFGERFLMNLSAGWWRQETSSNFRADPRLVDDFRVSLGFTWSLDPIEF